MKQIKPEVLLLQRNLIQRKKEIEEILLRNEEELEEDNNLIYDVCK